MASRYIISRRLDPLFALSIGVGAAATRINREEKEKGRGTAETVEVFKRRWNVMWEEKVGK
ncbi:hypothetical protein BU26DRAFT_523653 [Trematosphaeria pertusa]|uniref:Non-classical export protein 1 n=1 Tax=Trematosphaeria pertusa TaxID=390896 RepID=A0A6A6HZ66_9PLEO|nr:uncharacterized protein BU26DRAFT_523653 [Trematosphaeria pertusa]KAF2243316.1 hypothetical protein BU26DRAFT_523653 [Trematosphaeria pertusa]